MCEKIEVTSSFRWKSGILSCAIQEFHGLNTPKNILDQMRVKIRFDEDSELHKKVQPIVDYIGERLPSPKPLELGGESPITGEVTEVIGFDFRIQDERRQITVLYHVRYKNDITMGKNHYYQLSELPDFIQDLVRQIHSETNNLLKEKFWSRYGKGEINPQKWKAKKHEVFISYRASGEDTAQLLYDELGHYEEQSVFLPRIDRVDLSFGNWMNQLMTMIKQCSTFIPILTTDYLKGPIASAELDLAMRQELSDSDKSIVPVLIEDTPKQYIDHMLGGYQMIKAPDGLTPEVIKKIVYDCLGISKNPYEN